MSEVKHVRRLGLASKCWRRRRFTQHCTATRRLEPVGRSASREAVFRQASRKDATPSFGPRWPFCRGATKIGRRRSLGVLIGAACLWATLTSCGPSEADDLRAQVVELESALEQANEQIRQAADEIENAQATVGQAYGTLSDAVESMTAPEEVPIP